ncbi:hypothetical protein ACFE04_026528 [Oxalis oulophora]
MTIAIPEKVCELLQGPRRCWNVNLIRVLFNTEQVNDIQSIPLVNGNVNDAFIWDGTSNGVYTVKSGYKVAKDILFKSMEPDLEVNPRRIQWTNQNRHHFWAAGRQGTFTQPCNTILNLCEIQQEKSNRETVIILAAAATYVDLALKLVDDLPGVS